MLIMDDRRLGGTLSAISPSAIFVTCASLCAAIIAAVIMFVAVEMVVAARDSNHAGTVS